VSCWAIAAGADDAATAASPGGGQNVATATGGKVNTAVVPMPGGSDTWRARHKAMNARAKEGHVDLVYIGDSIVGNWKWDGKPVWDHYYAKRNGTILGISGDRTEQVLWRMQNGNVDGISPKLAIVMIGQNNGPFNTGEEIGAGVTAIVQTLRKKLPETKILVLAIFPRGEKPTEERAVLAKANEIASKLADGKYVFYMDVNYLFLRPDGSIPASLMPDFEHPNREGHRVWAAAIEPKVAELMGDAPTAEMPAKPEAKPESAPKH
jgi:beta-glucosidase